MYIDWDTVSKVPLRALFGVGAAAVPAVGLREALDGPAQGLGCRVLVALQGQVANRGRSRAGGGSGSSRPVPRPTELKASPAVSPESAHDRDG